MRRPHRGGHTWMSPMLATYRRFGGRGGAAIAVRRTSAPKKGSPDKTVSDAFMKLSKLPNGL